jgi:hypothetical protein
MSNHRLLIVGMFAALCAWLPGKVTAEERDELPSTYSLDTVGPLPSVSGKVTAEERNQFQLPPNYTLDLFQSRPAFNRIAANPKQNAANPSGYQPAYGDQKPAYGERLISLLPGSDRPALSNDPLPLPTFDLRPAGNRTGGMNWDPLALDDLSAPKKVAAQRPPMASAEDNSVIPCGHACPVCQGLQSPESSIDAAAQYVPEEPAETRLREGEPAKLLLQTMKQVRPSIIDGTIFQDSRPIADSEAMPLEGEGSAAIIVRCIRNLEAQAEHQRMPVATTSLISTPAPDAPSTLMPSPETTPEAVSALRQAGRDLESTANMLEERGLYDQADHLRAVAQEMRIEARAATASDHPSVSYCPTPMPGPGSDGDELAGEKPLEEPQPKPRYDSDGEDQD